MALNANKLIKTLDDKSKLYFNTEYSQFSEIFKEKLYRVIAESVIEHFKENAEVKVIIVGLDGGAAISNEYLERFLARGDLQVPGGETVNNVEYPPLFPSTELQTTTQAGAGTEAAVLSKVLSTPGFID